ncbi:MAG: MurR/RpiR family transcriptional regulator [Pseudomonadota bacterium]
MKGTSVPEPTNAVASANVADAQARLAEALPALTPELRKAAVWVLENPSAISISSVRQIAEEAGVKPNTLVRMARAAGFDGFDDLRRPYREDVLTSASFPDRARWLQELGRGGALDGLYARMAAAALSTVEDLYAANAPKDLKAAADDIVAARRTYVLGVGVSNPPARNFSYLAGMALDGIMAIPQAGSLPADDLGRANHRDILLAMTFKPYRREVIEAVETAHSQGVRIIGVSDSPASPILTNAAHRFIVPTETPQAFTSTVALNAFLETLMAFVIADADGDALANIEAFHTRRHALGIYWEEP